MRGSGSEREKERRRGRLHGAELPGIPEDALHDCARVTWIGQGMALVEGQRGVVELSARRIRIRTGGGVLSVLGEGLSLGELSADAAMLRGRIETLTYGRVDARGDEA